MLCPRCGGQWDTTRGSCMNCGLTVRMMSSPGMMASSPVGMTREQEAPAVPPASMQNSGSFPAVRRRPAVPGMGQQSGKFPAMRPQGNQLPGQQPGFQSGGVPRQQRQQPQSAPGFTNTASPLIPSRSANVGLGNPSSSNDATARPIFEKHVLRKVQPGMDEAESRLPFPQMPPPSTDVLSFQDAGLRLSSHTPQQTFRSTDYLEHDIPVMPPLSQPGQPSGRFNGVNTFNGASAAVRPVTRNSLLSSPAQPRAVGSPQASAMYPRETSQPFAPRPLLPGTLLRKNRYRLQELQERQDWLSGVFEAVWLGLDAHRNGAQVMICEVALPEPNSVMTQTLLRTATMALVSVGRHRHIPALWDAFSDQGRSFFVFELIDGESIYARLRYTGRPMPEQEVVECCLQMTEVLELLAQQSPPFVHGLIRPEHILVGRNGSQYYLNTFSVVLAGGGTQYVAGMERARLSPYSAPEFARGVADARSDIYSLIATAYYAVTGTVPSGASGSVTPAQRINNAVSPEFDAILMKGLRSVAGQRYQRPSELRQDLLALRSVSGTIVPGGNDRMMQSGSPVDFGWDGAARSAGNGAQFERGVQQQAAAPAPALPIKLVVDDPSDERVVLLPKPEDLPPMPASNDRMNAVVLLSVVLVALIILVVLSQTLA